MNSKLTFIKQNISIQTNKNKAKLNLFIKVEQ